MCLTFILFFIGKVVNVAGRNSGHYINIHISCVVKQVKESD